MTDFVKRRIVRARRGYQCDDCGFRIISGDRYEYLVGKNDATNYRLAWLRICIRCLERDGRA